MEFIIIICVKPVLFYNCEIWNYTHQIICMLLFLVGSNYSYNHQFVLYFSSVKTKIGYVKCTISYAM